MATQFTREPAPLGRRAPPTGSLRLRAADSATINRPESNRRAVAATVERSEI